MKRFAWIIFVGIALAYSASGSSGETLRELADGWNQPDRTYKSHTRWWWPGNALTEQDISWQLEQMAQQQFGGVEIMSAWQMYDQGGHDFLTPEFMGLVKHAVAEGKRLDLEVAITFSPGWSFGGPWVVKEDQSKVLCCGSQELAGGTLFSGALPLPGQKGEVHSLVAVVAGKLNDAGQLDETTLTVLTPSEMKLEWNVPSGRWKLMAFWLKYTGQVCQAQNLVPPAMVIDHMDKGAVQRYCDYLGGAFAEVIGDDFGTTVDSFFCDSFEIHPSPNSLLWSTGTLAGFEEDGGYDLTRYLPAIWFDIGPLTPRVRYDLGSYLHEVGLETVYKTVNDWCDSHNLQARIQPHYRFTPELVQAAGATARPETEVTTARFEPIADPRKATASGARFYGRDIFSAESYTFIHPKRYRTDLQDLKIATDSFLRDGITQFYNHGYVASPEKHVAPTRDVPWANRISHWNSWWPYYHHFADYVARSCYLLRQGEFMADVLIYSPQATIWSEEAIWENRRRVMPYGNLAKTLVANGYDFDIVNDDLLQNDAEIRGTVLEVAGHERRILILPNITVIPIETMRVIRDFAESGGTVIALEELPSASAGLVGFEANDRELGQLVKNTFVEGSNGVFLPDYVIGRAHFSPMRKPYSKTAPLDDAQRSLLTTLGNVIEPDFSLQGNVQSDGLTFIHRKIDDVDLYFVSNLQPTQIVTEVTFRVAGKMPVRWDAITGEKTPLADFQEDGQGTVIPVNFQPWESSFFLFAPGVNPPEKTVKTSAEVLLPVSMPWKMKLAGYGFKTFETNCTSLTSWTDLPRTRHFSGTGIYETEFEISADRLKAGARLVLDLGKVGNLADVELNGQAVGVSWMAPHRLDITEAVHAGKNKLVVKVTNTLINYVSGLKEPPEVPLELQDRLGKHNPAVYSGKKNLTKEMKETNLPPSGLIGPVSILCK